MVFINFSGIIGQVIQEGTLSTTGSLFMTLFVIILLLFAIAMMFGIPMEYTAIIMLPLLLALMSSGQQFVIIVLVALLYLSIILTKNFLFR